MNPAELFRLETDTINLSPGEIVFNEGDKGDLLYVLLEGAVQIRVGDVVVETAERGAIFGEMALIDDSPRSASATATAPSRIVGVNRRRFQFLVQQTPNFALQVMRVLADRLRRMDRVLGAR
ncbi:MAG TPA: cyclic nucleotide-binding domain-containing protein [Rudaea sp.]